MFFSRRCKSRYESLPMFSSVLAISNLCFKCFHLDVAKVDLDVVYIAMTKCACCKRMFQVFQVFFIRML
jgi:hypothetical protein